MKNLKSTLATTLKMKIEVFVSRDDENSRLDKFSSYKNPDYSRSFIQKAIEQGEITVNGAKSDKKYRLKFGDRVAFDIEPPQAFVAKPQNIPLDIVYEDEDILVVNKPKGMVVHPAPSHFDDTLVNALLFHCKELSDLNGNLRPGIVHRIDKDTSGLLMIAKNNFSHRLLAEQIKNHSFKRQYYAVVKGHLKDSRGTLDFPIGRDVRNRQKMAVCSENSKPAVTHYETVREYKGYSLVKCTLETGRTHQIRVHFAHIGHPVAGDEKYGGVNKLEKTLNGQCLHASLLGFIHPVKNEYMEFESELPDWFVNFLNRIEKA